MESIPCIYLKFSWARIILIRVSWRTTALSHHSACDEDYFFFALRFLVNVYFGNATWGHCKNGARTNGMRDQVISNIILGLRILIATNNCSKLIKGMSCGVPRVARFFNFPLG